MVEIGIQTTTVIVKKLTRRIMDLYHQLERRQGKDKGFYQEAEFSTKKLEEGVREFKKKEETIQSLASSEL